MFIDHATIQVAAGNGGDGCASFHRAKYIPKGGPDGGNGGDGGSVIARCDPNVHTLLDFRGVHHWKAAHGKQGTGSSRHGHNGEDCIIKLPPGTLIYRSDTNELIADLSAGDEFVLARGGLGGLGNEHFKSATNQTPRNATPGERGQAFELRLELKLIADVGLVGKPNAGKSTLLRSITRANPKVANYPFTTLSPQLGIAELSGARRIVVADIPGLIEGAAGGAGLGHDFLRHVERTRVLVHLLDARPEDGSTPADNYRAIRAELKEYSPELEEKREIIALSKADVLDEEERQEAMGELRSELRLGGNDEVHFISGATGENTRDLLEALWKIVGHAPAQKVTGWSVDD